jgi:uncharacterized Zn finger protein
MSRPRRPFGAVQPGRLPATMMKVLAAEMSDPQRLRKGKQYAKDGSVLDIIVEPGVVTCEVQGSRATPYIAALEVNTGDGMPLRRDVRAVCSCPDDDNWSNYACKHVIATMFVFADELLIEPELLDVWRGITRADTERHRSDDSMLVHDDEHDDNFDDDNSDDGDDELDSERETGGAETDELGLQRRRRHLQLVRDGMEQGRAERRDQHLQRQRETFRDPIIDVLTFPEGRKLPDIPTLERGDERLPRRPELAAILRDAFRRLRIDWD